MPAFFVRFVAFGLIAVCVAACAGSKGDPGEPGLPGPPGPPGPTGSVGVPDVTTARSIRATITGVTVAADTRATVRFTLRNEIDLPLRGLPAANLRLVIAQLRPGTGGAGSEWRAYTTRRDAGQVQATAEAATAAGTVFRDNGDGSYEFTFARPLNAYAPDGAVYDANLTHRVGLELRSTAATALAAANNAVFTFVPASGSTSSFPVRREIVDNDTCYACHDRLEFHGGPRSDVQYCVTCHNPGTRDGQAPNNSLDMTVMTHKIHMGNRLANGYRITGFQNVVYEFGTVRFTQDPRQCGACHQEGDPDTPDAVNWRTQPYARACGACHDDVDFATGANHGPVTNPGGPASDDQCITCHGPNSTIQNGALRVAETHRIPIQEASRRFRFNILGVSDTAPGQRPIVRFS
ncbi:MAG: OmcA/MtrC family decaheme c-type cytochrome, partial [Steroidobacteraceae bacterium]|nr:OmcA/MtrC family decaheme c-type cytochrome [Steroidobacteraceae bacterium]